MKLSFKSGDMNLKGYVDTDLAGNVNNRKNIVQYAYTLSDTTMS